MGASAPWSELSLHQLGPRPTVFTPQWTAHPCILYQVCATHGATAVASQLIITQFTMNYYYFKEN